VAKILLIAYDNDSYIHWPPQGLMYLASALQGHKVTIYSQDVYHWPEEHLTDYLDWNDFDVVGLGFVGGYYQYAKALKISRAVRAAKRRVHYILGGHGPSPEPEYFLGKMEADAVVCGEGERAVHEAIRRDGIFRGHRIEDIDSIPFPAWNLFPMDYYTLMREPHIRNNERCFPVITARGCPFKCNFCYRMDTGVRLRSAESIVEEVQKLKADYGVSYIAFNDELLMTSEARTYELCEAFMGLGIRWNCMGRLNFAKPELIQTMKRAGCVFINYGIECLDDQCLKNMNKNLTVEQITKGIEATLSAGVSPGFNIIFGNIGESEKTLQAGVDFLLKYDDHSQLRTIRPVTPYPGSPLYYHAIEKGLLGDVADFYENRHKNSDLPAVNFTNLPDAELNKCLYDANVALLENYHNHKFLEQRAQLHDLYFNNDTSFRGLRQT
jgi:radical SAM superfamily enzyme YgiQ (UPF0313 family)